MTTGGEKDSLIEAIGHGLSLGQGAIHIGTADFAPRWNHIVIETPPRGDTASNTVLEIQIRGKRGNSDGEIALQVMQPHAQDLGAFIGYGTDIDILSIATPPHQLYSELAKLINAIRELDLEQLAALEQSLIVLLDTEQVHLLFIAIPVPSNSLKASGAIVKGMGQDANLGLGLRQKLLLKKRI